MSLNPAGDVPDLGRALMLEYPQSIAVYDTYKAAQAAVDFLADKEFPVNQLVIVGTDLKTIERVIGRRTWGSVMGQGAMSGVFMGLLVGLMLGIFVPGQWLTMLLAGLTFGVAFGMINSAITYGLSRGQRDFSSVRQTVASKYEVLGEHKVVQQAREILRQAPGERRRLFEGGGTGVVNTPLAPTQQPWAQPTFPQQHSTAQHYGDPERPVPPRASGDSAEDGRHDPNQPQR